MASLLFPDDPQQGPGPQGLLAIPSGDWRDTIAPQPSAADAADATAREYRAFQERDRQRQIEQGFVDPKTGALTPEGWRQQAQVIGGGLGPADVGIAGGLLGTIKTYHGTPHLFEPTPKNPLGEFRLDKIGTGEGNQAFGQGMYVAEAEGVAREGYRDRLTRTDMPLYQGKPIGRGDEAYDVGSWMNERLKPGETMDDYLYRRASSLEDQGKFLRRGKNSQDQALGDFYLEAAKKMKAANPADWSFPTGHMYEVNLNAEPGDFLHWDKKYSQQSPEVQAKLADAYRARGMPLDADGNPLHFQRDPTGESMHASLSGAGGQELGAEVLRNAGIPGVRYLDRSSRGRDPNAPDATHNYAVFSPEIMEIVRRYGIAGLIGGGAAATAAASGQQDNNQ